MLSLDQGSFDQEIRAERDYDDLQAVHQGAPRMLRTQAGAASIPTLPMAVAPTTVTHTDTSLFLVHFTKSDMEKDVPSRSERISTSLELGKYILNQIQTSSALAIKLWIVCLRLFWI